MDVQVSEVRDMSKKSRLTGWAGGACNFSRLVLMALLLTAMTLVGGLGLRDANAAVSVTSLVNNSSTTDGTTFTTASITPVANELILAWVVNTAANAAAPTSLTGNGLTWQQVNSVQYNGTGHRIRLYRGRVPPGHRMDPPQSGRVRSLGALSFVGTGPPAPGMHVYAVFPPPVSRA